MDPATVNYARYRGDGGGFYESYFCRANHPSRPQAFWIRYTLFSPAGRPADAVGELWAVVFDQNTGEHVARKREVPMADCTFTADAFDVRVADAVLTPGRLAGAIDDVSWDLTFSGDDAPVLLLPERMYDGGLPKAKSLVSLPMATFAGALSVREERVTVEEWVGSQNHNWGSRHTDWYAWGQVAGFDDSADTFLEVSTARLKIGPITTPHLTPMVLRHRGDEHVLNAPLRTIGAHGRFGWARTGDGFEWSFRSGDQLVDVEGRIWAPAGAFVGLRYANPSGGSKICLNSKVASCDLRIGDRRTGTVDEIHTEHRAAFEVLTDTTVDAVPVRV